MQSGSDALWQAIVAHWDSVGDGSATSEVGGCGVGKWEKGERMGMGSGWRGRMPYNKDSHRAAN
jgi:hypothetical protein